MSGIYGIYRYDGAPVSRHWLECIRSAMAYYGPHGGANRIEDPVAFGHLRLEISPEDPFEKQPCEGTRGLVVSAARLDNRQELLDSFDIAPSDASRIPDGQLISLAFDRWGEDVAIHLQGDWAMAAWNRSERRLFLARDVFGNSTLYFHQRNGFIAFASSLKALLALPGVVKEPDPLRLAQVLVSWQNDAELTAYKGFRRLLWGQALTVGPVGENRISRYWCYEGRDLLNYRRDEDYEEAFLELYARAVRSCLRTSKPVAVMLSAGRDSGSVTAMAAPMLATQGRELTAYTSVPSFSPDGATDRAIGNEWDQAHTTAVMAGTNVRHIAVDAARHSVLQGIEHLLEVHDGPSHAASNHFWLQAITERSVQDGAGVLLTGQKGNTTISWRGNGSALLALLKRQPRTAWQLLLHAEPSSWLSLKRQILKPVLTPPLRWTRRLKVHGTPPWSDYSALNPHMASQLDLDSRMRAARHDPTFEFSPLEDLRSRSVLPIWCVGTGLWSEIGAMHAISFRDPTCNLAMVDFLLSVPDSQFRRNGEGSSLFRRAFRDRLPEPVLEGRRKGLQSADLGHRILAELPAIRERLASLEAHAAAGEFLDLPRLRDCLQNLEVKVDPGTTSKAGTILLRGLGVGLFLRRFA
jgi:asparagine synthase (glutamine-hydrolysing)